MDTNMQVTPVGMAGFGDGDNFFKYLILLGLLNGGGGLFGNNRAGITEAISAEGNWTTTIGKLDGISKGLCDLGYANAQGQNSIQMEIANGLANLGFQNTQGFNGISREITSLASQMANCCCETNRNIDALRYDMSKGFCDVVTAGNLNTRDIIANQTANTQRIVDLINENTTQALRDENASLKLQVSQQAQSQNIISEVVKHVMAICGAK